MLKLLGLGGIRKLKEIEMDKKIITVACKPRPDKEGIVRFDYSIFENRKRKESYYDMNACADYFIVKPYNAQILIVRIRKVLKRTYGYGKTNEN